MGLSMEIYNRMPFWSKNLAASLRGYYLSSWRYDEQTENLVETILERDYWDEKQWKHWREKRLAFILHRAAYKVPFYREQWAKRRREGDRSSIEYLENWKPLDKKSLRENPAAFVAEDCQRHRMFHDHTSGTTGTSLSLWASESTVKLWYAMFEARSRRWYGVSRRDRWAILGGQMIMPTANRRPPFWVWNAGMNQLYLSAYHLAPDLLSLYLDALKNYRVRYILGYPSAIYSLAKEVLARRRYDLKLDVIITNAEPLYDFQRELIAEAFRCPVRETYGMAETVAAAGECGRGKLHQWLDAGIVEQEKNFSSEAADFVCTGLVNADMPLIRYKVGDSGTFSDEKCICGRKLPLITKIDGRSDDLLLTADGRRVGRLDPIFKKDMPIIEAQIIQQSLKNLVVKIVPAPDFDQKAERRLKNAIGERLGEVEINIEKVAEIPRTARGKFRAVICNLSESQKREFTGH